MFMILWVGNSDRHQRVRQGTEDVALLLGSLCLGLAMLERLGWDRVSASHCLCVASVRAEMPRRLLYSHVRALSWVGGQGSGPAWLALSLGFLSTWPSRGI